MLFCLRKKLTHYQLETVAFVAHLGIACSSKRQRVNKVIQASIMSEQENENGFPLKFTPLTFTNCGNQQQKLLFNSPKVNLQSSSILSSNQRVLFPSPRTFSRSSANTLNSVVSQSHENPPPFSPRVLFPQSTQPLPSTPTTLISGTKQAYSGPDNFLPSSQRVFFPRPPSDTVLFPAKHDQSISTHKKKAIPIDSPLHQVQQNVQGHVPIKEEEKDQTESYLQEISIKVELLQNSNDKLVDSFQYIKEELQDVKRISQESQNEITDTTKALEELGKDRSNWITQMQEFQRHSDKRTELLLADFQKNIDEKETQMDALRGRAEQVLTQLGNTTAERDSTKQKLNETIKELDQAILDKAKIFQERNQLEIERDNLTQSFKNMLNERVNKVIEELSEEQSRSQAILHELNDCRDKIFALQVDHQKILSEMEELSRADQKEIALLKEKIAKLSATNEDISCQLIAAEEQLASQQQTMTTFGDIKVALSSVSKERASLQERYTALEAQLVATNKSLALSTDGKVELERSVEDLNRQLLEEIELKNKTHLEVVEVSQQLAASNAMIEEKLKKITDLESQLSATNGSVREMQDLLVTQSQSSKKMETQLEDYNKRQIEFENNIAELKHDLMGNSIQLTYKEKRIAELEDTLKNLQDIKSESEVPDSKIATELEKINKRLRKKTLELQISNTQLKENQEKLIIAEKNVAVLESQVNAQKKSLDDKLYQELQEPSKSHPQSVDVPTAPSECNPSIDLVEVLPAPVVQQKSILKKSFSAICGHEETMALIRKAEEKADEIKRTKGMSPTLKSFTSSSNISSSSQEKRRRFDSPTQTRLSVTRTTRSTNVDVQEVHSTSPVIRAVSTYSRKNKRGSSKDRKSLN